MKLEWGPEQSIRAALACCLVVSAAIILKVAIWLKIVYLIWRA